MISDPNRLLPGLQWQTREKFERLAAEFQRQAHLGVRVRSGARSCATQNGYYAQGRTTPGDVVTYAQGCHSWHVLGRAIDADPINLDGSAVGLPSDYELMGAIWKRLGGVWGGDFQQLDDPGHFEYHPGLEIEDICPDPRVCIEGSIQTETPATWPWVACAAVVAGAAAWMLLP